MGPRGVILSLKDIVKEMISFFEVCSRLVL